MSQRQLQTVNVALTTANNEYSITIPTGAINVQMKLADAALADVSVNIADWLLALGGEAHKASWVERLPATRSSVSSTFRLPFSAERPKHQQVHSWR
jgi:hypothetical protein